MSVIWSSSFWPFFRRGPAHSGHFFISWSCSFWPFLLQFGTFAHLGFQFSLFDPQLDLNFVRSRPKISQFNCLHPKVLKQLPRGIYLGHPYWFLIEKKFADLEILIGSSLLKLIQKRCQSVRFIRISRAFFGQIQVSPFLHFFYDRRNVVARFIC